MTPADFLSRLQRLKTRVGEEENWNADMGTKVGTLEAEASRAADVYETTQAASETTRAQSAGCRERTTEDVIASKQLREDIKARQGDIGDALIGLVAYVAWRLLGAAGLDAFKIAMCNWGIRFASVV